MENLIPVDPSDLYHDENVCVQWVTWTTTRTSLNKYTLQPAPFLVTPLVTVTGTSSLDSRITRWGCSKHPYNRSARDISRRDIQYLNTLCYIIVLVHNIRAPTRNLSGNCSQNRDICFLFQYVPVLPVPSALIFSACPTSRDMINNS